jgi:hypothetical protein
MVVFTCVPRYVGGTDKRVLVQASPRQKLKTLLEKHLKPKT